MKCPSCGGNDLFDTVRDVPYTYKNQSTTIPEIKCQYCPDCEEIITDSDETERLMEAMKEFSKEVNSSTVDPIFVLTVRRKLNLDQKEAASIFGGGPNAFSRYERGVSSPPLALIKLLKLLDKHPELLEEIKS